VELRVRSGRRRRQRAHHEHSRTRQPHQCRQVLPGQVSKSALHAVADDGVAHGLAHHEPHTRRSPGRLDVEVDHERAGPTATTRSNRDPEGVTVDESVRRGQHERDRRGRSRQTARLLRPLRRRADRIERPARVRMRRRKPCTLWRRRLFGWYVRLLTSFSPMQFLLGCPLHRRDKVCTANRVVVVDLAFGRHRPPTRVNPCGSRSRGHAAPVDTE